MEKATREKDFVGVFLVIPSSGGGGAGGGGGGCHRHPPPHHPCTSEPERCEWQEGGPVTVCDAHYLNGVFCPVI